MQVTRNRITTSRRGRVRRKRATLALLVALGVSSTGCAPQIFMALQIAGTAAGYIGALKGDEDLARVGMIAAGVGALGSMTTSLFGGGGGPRSGRQDWRELGFASKKDYRNYQRDTAQLAANNATISGHQGSIDTLSQANARIQSRLDGYTPSAPASGSGAGSSSGASSWSGGSLWPGPEYPRQPL